MKLIDIHIGTKFGKWTVSGDLIRKKYTSKGKKCRSYLYPCICECGKEQNISATNLTKGLTAGCRSCVKRRFLEIGKTYGKWTIIGETKSRDGVAVYICECQCGLIRTMQSHFLSSSRRTGCRKCNYKPKDGYSKAQNGCFNGYKNSAKSRGFAFELDKLFFMEITSKDCFYCGLSPSNCYTLRDDKYTYNGIDRIDSSIGYVKDNCVPCCWVCNSAKRDMPYDDWILYIKRLTEHQNQRSISIPASNAV